MTVTTDEFDRQLETFRATWRKDGLKDPELTYVVGNLNGFIAHMRRAGFRLVPDPARDPGRAPNPFVDAAERAALGLP